MPGRHRHTSIAAAAVLAVGLSLAASPARADPNLESRFPRNGFYIGAGFGPGMFRGSGEFRQLFGIAGDATLRVGVTAGPRLLWLVQLDSVAYLAEDKNLQKQKTNAHTIISLAGQYYVRETMWLKAGFGPATLTQREKGGDGAKQSSSGFGLMASGGLDLFRRGRFVVDVESTFVLGIYDNGTITQFGVKFVANWY